MQEQECLSLSDISGLSVDAKSYSTGRAARNIVLLAMKLLAHMVAYVGVSMDVCGGVVMVCIAISVEREEVKYFRME